MEGAFKAPSIKPLNLSLFRAENGSGTAFFRRVGSIKKCVFLCFVSICFVMVWFKKGKLVFLKLNCYSHCRRPSGLRRFFHPVPNYIQAGKKGLSGRGKSVLEEAANAASPQGNRI